MEDARTSEDEDDNIDSQDSKTLIDHGHLAQNCSIKIIRPAMKASTHLLLRMSPTAGDETSRGRNPGNGRCRDFRRRRRRYRQSGFQHTNRPWPSSPELFNKDHNAGRESLSHLLLRMSPTAGDETSRGRNPEKGRCRDFGRR